MLPNTKNPVKQVHPFLKKVGDEEADPEEEVVENVDPILPGLKDQFWRGWRLSWRTEFPEAVEWNSISKTIANKKKAMDVKGKVIIPAARKKNVEQKREYFQAKKAERKSRQVVKEKTSKRKMPA